MKKEECDRLGYEFRAVVEGCGVSGMVANAITSGVVSKVCELLDRKRQHTKRAARVAKARYEQGGKP